MSCKIESETLGVSTVSITSSNTRLKEENHTISSVKVVLSTRARRRTSIGITIDVFAGNPKHRYRKVLLF